MKKIYLKLMALALLSVLSVTNAWATKRVWIDVTSAPSGYTTGIRVQYNDGTYKHTTPTSYGTIGGKTIYSAEIPDDATTWEVHRGDDESGTNDYNWQGELTYATYNKYTVTGWDKSGSGSKVIGMVTGGYIYYDDHLSNWNGSAYKYFVIGHDSYYGNTRITTTITNTKLWYLDNNSAAWPDAKYFAFIAHTGEYPSASNPWSDIDTWAEHKTAQYTSDYNLVTDGRYLFIPSASGERQSFTINDLDEYSDFDRTITIGEKYNASGTTPWAEVNDGTTHGTITASGKKFDSWTTCAGSSSCSVTKETSTYSANADFGYTSTVTLTAGATKAGKAFVGWYRSNGTLISTNTETTITVTGNETIYAHYKDEVTHDVTVSYMCSSTSIQDGVTESAVGITTTRSVTAPNIDHYEFVEWTHGSGVTVSSTTAKTITINSVDGQSSEAYYLIANYKKLTRFYFHNAGNWSKVYAYMWKDKGTANDDWPGVEMTTKDDVACGTRYYYDYDADSEDWDQIIFNEGSGEGKAKTGDLSIEDHEDELFVWTNSGDAKGSWYDLSNHSVAVATEASYKGTVSGGGTAKAYGCSAEITATPAPGYRFSSWSVTTGTAVIANASSATTTVTASTDATITASFTQEGIILFDNTMSQWKGDIYVYLYTNETPQPWWSNKDGSNNGPGVVLKKTDGTVLYNKYGQMTRIGSSDVYYFDYAAVGLSGSSIKHVVFTKGDYHTSAGLYQTSAAYRSDFDDNYVYRDFPMYIASQTWSTTNETGYHNSGYWKKYNVTYSGFDLRGTFNSWTGDQYPFTSTIPNSNTFKTTVHLNAGTPEFKIYRGSLGALGNNGTMTASNHSGWEMTEGTNNCKIEIPAGGDYEFTINLGTDHIYLSVEYPLLENDYRLLYTGRITTDGSDEHYHPTQAIRHLTKADTTTHDTVSLFIVGDHKGTLQLQKCTDPAANDGTGAWADTASTISLSSISETGIYNFVITQTTAAAGVRTASVTPLADKYSGKLYIRTDVADGGWEAYKEVENNILQYSDYSKANSGYDLYHVHWAPTSKNLHFTIANDYSPSISDTMTNGESPFTFDALPYQASVRFMYNSETNKLDRAYLNGSSEGGDATYLMLKAKSDSITETNGDAIGTDANGYNSTTFTDLGNWVYQKDLKAIPGTHIRLISNYYYSSTPHYQYFKGSEDDENWDPSNTELIIGGTGDAQTLRLVYDYKTNHLVSAWLAPESGETANLALYADVMILREEQKAARQIYFSSSNKLTEVDTVYAVMQFNKYSLNNRNKVNNADSIRTEAQRNIYWISFPFDVKLNDVFGFGTYGTHWGIEYYDGKARAQEGYWVDSDGFWKFVSPEERSSFILKANVGYLLVLDLDLLDTGSKVWEYTDNVSLYFPSKDRIGSIQTTDKTVTIDQEDYLCTIDRRTDKSVSNINKDRRIADSYWHVIGVPSYANKTRESLPIEEPNDPEWTGDILYLYEWNGVTGEYTVTSSASVDFKTMYSYMVQYSGETISWTSVSATPDKANIIARKTDREDYNLRLEISKGGTKEDQTYIRLTDNENVSNEFEFNFDLFKELNGGKANIWTVTSDGTPAAGNVMPFGENTTVVPVGIKVKTNSEYTFTIPEGTNGVGVYLIDNATGARTNLALENYTVNLNTGQYDGRFFLEISSIAETPTSIETTDDSQNSNIHKVIVDGILYIIKDGRVFDAQGRRL